MKLRPIVGRQHEVRAILAGHQTQIRRVMKVQPECISELWQWIGKGTQIYEGKNLQSLLGRLVSKCPYGTVGDRLWVREGYRQELNLGHDKDGNWPDADSLYSYFYKADCDNPKGWGIGVWKPPIHMPRTASRIELEITDIRVERVQDISEADAIAEGVEVCSFRGLSAEEEYSVLWTQIHGYDDQKGWNANPWVWVIQFKPVGGVA